MIRAIGVKKEERYEKNSWKRIVGMVLTCSMLISGVPVLAQNQNMTLQDTQAAAQFEVSNLTTEYRTNPLGIDTDQIRFGWQMQSTVIGTQQTAYQVQVFEADTDDLVWDSGKVKSALSTGIVCEEPVEEATGYRWEVTVWNELDTAVTAEAYFETGVTNQRVWKNTDFVRLNASSAAPVFRTEQSLDGADILRARLYITAMGAYEAYVNGSRVGEWDENGEVIYHHMNPGYGNKTVSLGYQTYDVTPFLAEEESVALSVVAGNGWYYGMGTTNAQPAVKALLVIDYEDGTRQTIDTNTTDWKGTLAGGITANGVYYGEDYNAIFAEALGDFTQIGYDDAAWVNGDGAEQSIPCITDQFEQQTASHVRLLVKETGPAVKEDNENRLQIMELELLDGTSNVAKGVVPTVSNTFEYGTQWTVANLTDGSYGQGTDAGYTSEILGFGATAHSLNDPITIQFDFNKEVRFSEMKIYPRTGKEAVAAGLCVNYPKVYSLQISDDGITWEDVLTDQDSGMVGNSEMNGDVKMSTTTYPGEIRAQLGLPGRMDDTYDQYPVSAYLYTGTVPNSSYAGGEVAIDVSYEDEELEEAWEEGILLESGQTMIINMGQNLTAVPNISFEAAAGTVATMKFAEMLNDGSSVGNGATQADGPKGSIYQKSLRGARSAAVYTFSGNGLEIYQPSMSFYGYQYIQLTATDDVIVYGVVSKSISSVTEQTGFVETNNENVNKLFSNVLYGQMSNYYTTPTDCNQRDERLSWTGDTQAFAQTGVYNFDSIAFLGEMQDIYNENTRIKGYVPGVADDLNGFFSPWATGWSDVEVVLPWTLYLQTGDISMIEESWDAMNHYMDYLRSNERGADQAPATGSQNYGDWLAFQGTCIEVMNDYYYGYVTLLMAQMADIIGDDAKEEQYYEKFEALKEKFLETHVEFTNGDLLIKSDVGDRNLHFMNWTDKKGIIEANSQTSLLWMLKLGYYDSEEMKEAALALLLENIKNENPDPNSVRAKYGENTLAVGFLGSNVITPVLTEMGCAEVSYDLLLQDEQPSWLFEVKAGATTIWERWNSFTPGVGFGDSEMNSFNHYAYGSVVEWMYRYMAGIAADERHPGFKKIVLQPTLDTGEQYNDEERIDDVEASYSSYYGEIEVNWSSSDGDLRSYDVKIPANTTAELYLPVNKTAMENFVPVKGMMFKGMEEHNGMMCARIDLTSGGYAFDVKNKQVTVTVADGYVSEYPKDKIELPYEDVAEQDWFYEAVYYTFAEGLMTGMDATHFGPYGQLSRAQFALMLYRMEGEQPVETAKSFKDIAGNEWYGPAVLWAAEKGIVTGYQDGNFGPADMITREQMAVMMYRYADYLGMDVKATADFADFKDAESVSPFAVDAMGWAVGNAIITGKDNGTRIDPQGNTARSEAAIIIQRFMEK